MSSNQLLTSIYLFKDMTASELQKIEAIMRIESYASGDEIFTENDQATAMYVLKYGSVRIMRRSSGERDIEVALLGSGSHFGEMAFLDNERRSASAVAVEKSEILVVFFEDLKKLLESDSHIAVKFYHALSTFLCGRLRVTTSDLSFAREKNFRHF